jgi:oxygen-independent coproporphyrinogen-3 oxidase
LKAYLRELEFYSKKLGKRSIKTIFFGGGTPSLMPVFMVEKIIEKISELWSLDPSCEITLEANPTSFEAEKFKDFCVAGINRLSLGIQALNDQDLRFLGREHSAEEAIKTIETAAKIFNNFSFDLIYARPEQDLNSWREELMRAINFGTKHLSLYQLTIEKGTKFFGEYQRQKFQMPDEEKSARFYEITNQITSSAGLEIYEISNYAKNGSECAHNLVYWRGGDYLGIGAGAHSRIFFEGENIRTSAMNIHDPINWLKSVEEKGNSAQFEEKISLEDLQKELILMGLRLREGADKKFFDSAKAQKLINQGLLEVFGKNFRIPNNFILLTNSILQKLV